MAVKYLVRHGLLGEELTLEWMSFWRGLGPRPAPVPEYADPKPPVQEVSSTASTSKDEVRPTPSQKPTPVTVLTGWLGAGKTTLVQNIMAEAVSRGKKVAIVNNEVAEAGVEDLSVYDQDADEKIENLIELGSGCVCCSVRNDFVAGLEELMRRRHFDYILVECSGVANPGPVAEIFWVDEELESRLYLDSIVTVVDSLNLHRNLAGSAQEARQVKLQLAYADVVVLNKRDLVKEEDIPSLEEAVRGINRSAAVHVATKSDVGMDHLIGLK